MSLPYNAVKRFYSTDVGAPSLSGTVGALITVLDAVLVNGYGTVSVSSITRSGSTVTVETSTAHGHDVGTVIKIAGADQTDYNGEWIVASLVDSTHLTFDCGVLTPVTPATGSMTLKRASMNLTKAFSGTNKAAYKLPTGTTEGLLRVDDTTTTYANVTGYESMTDVDTGSAQLTSGTSAWSKSSSADATARPWIAYADDRYIWILIRWHASNGRYSVYAYGDPIPTNSMDAYHTSIIADTSTGGSNPGNNGDFKYLAGPFGSVAQWTVAITNGHRIARSYNQLGASIGFAKIGLASTLAAFNVGSLVMSTVGMAFPAPHDNGVYVAPLYMIAESVFRATLPGIQSPLHAVSTQDNVQYANLIGLPGRTVEFQLYSTTGTSYASVGFDITGPWR